MKVTLKREPLESAATCLFCRQWIRPEEHRDAWRLNLLDGVLLRACDHCCIGGVDVIRMRLVILRKQHQATADELAGGEEAEVTFIEAVGAQPANDETREHPVPPDSVTH